MSTAKLRLRYGSRPAGGDARYEYVPFYALTQHDQQIALRSYPYTEKHLPDTAYLYPVTKNGRLASARRYMPRETAERLFKDYQFAQSVSGRNDAKASR